MVESALENYRVRQVTIFFYLEDNSISLTEPKMENSGIPQGIFLKRQKVLKNENSGYFISIEDLKVGEDIVIFGKNIHIYDCDQYTREFYENLGKPQGSAEECPKDSWNEKATTSYIPQKDNTMKDFMEHKLGGGRVTSQKQFLENDRRVLKYYVFSDIPYIMHYYLADDTIEIREINHANSGRDPFPLLLRRMKMPRKMALNQPGQTYAEDFIRPEDIKFGEPLDIFGRKFQINGCDVFTHNYYKEKLNCDFPLSSSEPSNKKD